MDNFLSRQPRISLIIGKSIKIARAKAASPKLIGRFLNHFYRLRTELNIPAEYIYNIDETDSGYLKKRLDKSS